MTDYLANPWVQRVAFLFGGVLLGVLFEIAVVRRLAGTTAPPPVHQIDLEVHQLHPGLVERPDRRQLARGAHLHHQVLAQQARLKAGRGEGPASCVGQPRVEGSRGRQVGACYFLAGRRQVRFVGVYLQK